MIEYQKELLAHIENACQASACEPLEGSAELVGGFDDTPESLSPQSRNAIFEHSTLWTLYHIFKKQIPTTARSSTSTSASNNTSAK
jgi:hypothetical protein